MKPKATEKQVRFLASRGINVDLDGATLTKMQASELIESCLKRAEEGATERQIAMLERNGFEESASPQLTKARASRLISRIPATKQQMQYVRLHCLWSDYTMLTKEHAGRLISDHKRRHTR